MYFHLKKKSFLMQLSIKVFIPQIDEGHFQGEEIVYF